MSWSIKCVCGVFLKLLWLRGESLWTMPIPKKDNKSCKNLTLIRAFIAIWWAFISLIRVSPSLSPFVSLLVSASEKSQSESRDIRMAFSLEMSPYIFKLFCLFRAVAAFHSGAPCSTQYSMTPSRIFHGAPRNPVTQPPPYEFQIADTSGNPVNTYKDEIYRSKIFFCVQISCINWNNFSVRIRGINTFFRGFLLQARPASHGGSPSGDLRAGVFIRDGSWQSQGIQIQPCPGVFSDSLTHSINSDRKMVEVYWRPIKNYGPIVFV